MLTTVPNVKAPVSTEAGDLGLSRPPAPASYCETLLTLGLLT